MKREPLYKRYAETRAYGVYPMCNFGGLEILNVYCDDDMVDYAVACFNFGTGRQKIRRHKIQVSESGRAFIRKEGVRYYFDQIMKV